MLSAYETDQASTALPPAVMIMFSANDGDRTRTLLLDRETLGQLSYVGIARCLSRTVSFDRSAESGGLEPQAETRLHPASNRSPAPARGSLSTAERMV